MKYTQQQMSHIERVAGDRRTLANYLNPLLSMDGRPYEGPDVRDLVAGGSDGRTVEASDGPGVELTAKVAGTLPDMGQRVEMDFDISGTVLPGFRGRLRASTAVDFGTEIKAYTSAYHWGRSPLRTELAPLNTPRNHVLFSALSGLSQLYDGVEIPASVAEPPVTLQGSEALGEWDTVADAVDAVEGSDDAQVCRVLDTALNVATAFPMTPIEADATAVWEFREGEDCDFGAVSVEQIDEERFYAVAVVRRLEDGTQELLAFVRIDNGDAVVSPTDIYVMESTDQSAETPSRSPKTPAYVIAFNEAMRRGRNARKLTVPVCYWPIWLERGDVVAVETREFTGQTPESPGQRGSIYRRYIFRVDGYLWGPSRDEASVTGEGLLVRTRFVADVEREPILLGDLGELFGHSYAGNPYLSTDLPWVTYVPERNALILNTEVAEEYNVDITEIAGPKVRIRG